MTPAGEDDLQKEQEEVEMDTDDQHSEKKFHSADVQSPVNSGKSLGPLSGQKNTFSTSEKEYRVPGGPNHVTTRHTPKESLHIIFDEAPWFFSDIFQLLVEKAKDAYGEIHCWTASPFYGSRPASFAEVKLTNTPALSTCRHPGT
nr:hypothetical protein BaRGS_007272 [Batillaria attramentaria]